MLIDDTELSTHSNSNKLFVYLVGKAESSGGIYKFRLHSSFRSLIAFE